MRPRYLSKAATHRQTMTNYYGAQSLFYDATRWSFLYGRARLVEALDILPGDRVLEIGCGTGSNFNAIQKKLHSGGELIGVDCSAPMLCKAAARVRQRGWRNVRLLDLEYGKETITRGRADVVIFSYSLSMIDDWEMSLACAHSELWSNGRIGVVDFCRVANGSNLFASWLATNHVNVDRPYEQKLCRLFRPEIQSRHVAWAGLWSFYMFVGARFNRSLLFVPVARPVSPAPELA
jgi:S-adenosylmethionine-diacylgycerolhomoserine-N-methlytransferase